MTVAHPIEPSGHVKAAGTSVNVGTNRGNQLALVKATDGILSPHRGNLQAVIPHGIHRKKSGAPGRRPFDCIGRVESRIDHSSLCAAEVAFERVLLATVSVNVADPGALFPCFAEHVGITGIQTLDGCAFIASRER